MFGHTEGQPRSGIPINSFTGLEAMRSLGSIFLESPLHSVWGSDALNKDVTYVGVGLLLAGIAFLGMELVSDIGGYGMVIGIFLAPTGVLLWLVGYVMEEPSVRTPTQTIPIGGKWCSFCGNLCAPEAIMCPKCGRHFQ